MSTEIYAALIGASAAILTLLLGAKFTRKQRTREELYAHKVKAYSELAILIAEVRHDYEALAALETGSDIVAYKNPRSPFEIDRYFRRKIIANYLFFSKNTKSKTDELTEKIRYSSQLAFNKSSLPDLVSSEDIRKCYENMIVECEMEIERLYQEIGLSDI